MNSKNPYESLKTDCLDDVDPVDAQSVWCITGQCRESITICTSLLPDGAWVYGYIVQWANGRTSSQKPTAALGLFRTQREAKLHAIGFMLIYLEYFQPETQVVIHRAESSLLQGELF